MGLQFGMSAVQSGKRVLSGNSEPNLVATITKGRFTITGIISRTLGLIPGDYVQFISNIASIDAAIAERDSEVLLWCQENDVEFGTEAARTALIKEFGSYAICKGVPMYEKDGKRKYISVRMTSEQKEAAFQLNKEAIAAECGKSVDEITVDDFNPVTEAFTGSKATTSSALTGIGLALGFSEITVWSELKEDLGEMVEDINRVYTVNLQEPFECTINNGKAGEEGNVVVTAYPITFKSDEEPSRTTKKA